MHVSHRVCGVRRIVCAVHRVCGKHRVPAHVGGSKLGAVCYDAGGLMRAV